MTYPLLFAVLARLDASRGHLPDVAKGSGVPVATIRKIAQRVTPDPGVKTVEALAAYFSIPYMNQPAHVAQDVSGLFASSEPVTP